jgi:hypothetical protein
VSESYCRLARLCPLYDPTVGVYTPASIARLAQTDPFHRHRLSEGRRAWKLLFGEDSLSQLAPPTEDEASVGFEAELKLWWTYFARWAYGHEQTHDRVFLNSLCYKVSAECLRMERGLRGGTVPDSRRRAIEEAVAAPGTSEDAGFLTPNSRKCPATPPELSREHRWRYAFLSPAFPRRALSRSQRPPSLATSRPYAHAARLPRARAGSSPSRLPNNARLWRPAFGNAVGVASGECRAPCSPWMKWCC